MVRRAAAFALLVACGGQVADAKDAAQDTGPVVDTGLVLPQDAAPAQDAAAPSGQYFAQAVLGGYDRIFVYEKDTARDLCFGIGITMPSQASGGLSLPPPWGFEVAGVSQGAATCGTAPMNLVLAQSQSGTIAFTTSPQNPYPATLDVDVTLTFAPGSPAWVPPTEKLGAAGVPVTVK